VVLVQNQVFTGPVLEFCIQTVGNHEHRGFLVVVDGVAHVNAHKHCLVLVGQGNQLVLLVFELHHPRCKVVELPTYFLHDIVYYAVQFVLISVVKELHVLLFVLTAELGVLLPEFGLVLAAFLVTLELDNGSFPYDLHHCAFVEDVEDLELLLEIGEELGDQQDDHLLVLDESVNQLLPVLVLVVVDEHRLHLAEVAAFLLLAADELVFEELDLGLHLVGVEDDGIVDSTLALELSDLGVEELRVVVNVHQLVLGLDIGRVYCKLLLDAHHPIVHVEVSAEFSVLFTFVHVLDQVVNHFNLEFKVVLGLVVLEPFEVSTGVGLMGEVVDETHLSRFDLEFVVLTLADDDTLPFILQLLIVAIFELFVETEFVVIDNFMLVVHLVLLLHPLSSGFVLAYNEVFKVVVVHLALEFILYFFF